MVMCPDSFSADRQTSEGTFTAVMLVYLESLQQLGVNDLQTVFWTVCLQVPVASGFPLSVLYCTGAGVEITNQHAPF